MHVPELSLNVVLHLMHVVVVVPVALQYHLILQHKVNRTTAHQHLSLKGYLQQSQGHYYPLLYLILAQIEYFDIFKRLNLSLNVFVRVVGFEDVAQNSVVLVD